MIAYLGTVIAVIVLVVSSLVRTRRATEEMALALRRIEESTSGSLADLGQRLEQVRQALVNSRPAPPSQP